MNDRQERRRRSRRQSQQEQEHEQDHEQEQDHEYEQEQEQDQEQKHNDPKLLLGSRCLFVHFGFCAHPFYISDVSRKQHLHPTNIDTNTNTDGINSPYTTYLAPTIREKCVCCETVDASLVCAQDALAPHSPAFFCTSCFKQLHYDPKGILRENNEDFSICPYHYSFNL